MNNKRLYEWDKFQNIKDSINKGYSVALNGLSDAQRHHLIHLLVSACGKKALYITSNDIQARKALGNFRDLFSEGVYYFPFREKMLYDIEAKSHEQSFQRIDCLNRILNNNFTVIVLSCESLLDFFMPPGEFSSYMLNFKTGDTLILEQIVSRLINMGYDREEQVEGPGQFAVRGGILDLFPVQLKEPVRIELFDIEIDSIRTFDIITQRSIENLEEVDILPAKEFLLSGKQARETAERVSDEYTGFISKLTDKELKETFQNNFSQYIEKLGNVGNFAGIDKFIPYFYNSAYSIIKYLHSDILLFIEDVDRLKQRLGNTIEEHCHQCEILIEKGMILPGSYKMYFKPEDLPKHIEKHQCVYLNSLEDGACLTEVYRKYIIEGKNIDHYQGHLEKLKNDLRGWLKNGYLVTLLVSSEQRSEGILRFLTEDEICAASVYPSGDVPCVVVKQGQLANGFLYPEIKWVVVCESDINMGKKSRVSPQFKDSRKITVFTDLRKGDHVVHQTHGIGLYTGIESLEVEGVTREYLKVEYRDGGLLYIPTTQMDLIQKYIGTEGKTPRLNKLGGTEWTKEKNKVKESLRELAFGLIRLEAERTAREGFSFSSDTVWQQQFEECFLYEETKDQLRCTEEIKKDMESKNIMDRLLCGDVGYGKTEVSLRAVFKAAMDGKQSVFLVPTTVLASQHYENFKKRFGPFPITVEMLSRFRTESEQRKIIRDLKTGRIDVIVGTHKLLNQEIRFKDLGLLVIDEEQRFGVEHKEIIKKMYPKVDILTLSATPIPRTLHMSLTGIRDISTIEEPPEHRYPVQTYVLEFREDIIEDAVTREIAREGQVFYLFNRVKGIQAKSARLQELLPDVRVGYAHGQMSERQLEKTVLSFLNREFDVLVCTTIIESGIDMPNVNTIIVEDADKLGLAQLYQLRGRVGRSNRLAYAYLTYRKDKVLNEVAEKRLKAIREFTEFGSGFKIAMRDLQIRGAGNLLGPEQHGHIESVGYDTYVKLLEETVKELRGQLSSPETREVFIEFKLDAYVDPQYITDEKARLEMYKTIAAIDTEEEARDVYDELADRYGDIPEQTSNLVELALVKRMAGRCGFQMIKQKNEMILLYFTEDSTLPLPLLSSLMHEEKGRIMFSAGKTPYLSYKVRGLNSKEALGNIKILLQRILKLQLQE